MIVVVSDVVECASQQGRELRIDYNSKFGMDIVLNVSPRSILLSRLLSTKYKYNLLASLRSASNL